MERTLDQFYLLPQKTRVVLERAHIKTQKELLNRGAWTHDRSKLLKQLELTETDLRPWLIASDLCRIEGILPREAQKTALSGLMSSNASDLVEEVKEKAELIQCPACGEMLAAAARYCSTCGAAITATAGKK